MMLSPHFSLSEFTLSQTAARHEIDNTPKPEYIENLRRVAYTLELIRHALGRPIHISSGYRCPALNKRIGGAEKSRHMLGLAADFVVHGMTPAEIIDQIKGNTGYDLLINEFDSWVHLQISNTSNRQKVIKL